MTSRRSILLLAALQLAIVALVEPRGEFPLNDDWAYAHSVRWLLEEHRVRLSDWIAMNLLPQALLGGAVATLCGFSFEALRHLGQAWSLAALLLAFAWFRSLPMAPRDAVFAAVVLAAFPAWPVLSNSFMTDTLGLALGLAAATALLRWLRQPTAPWLALGTGLALIGVLQRQVVLVVPAAALAACLWCRPRDARRALMAAISLGVCLAGEAAYQAYLAAGPGIPEAQRIAHGRVLPLVRQALTNEGRHGEIVALHSAEIAALLGLFVAPWAAWRGLPLATRRARMLFLAGTAALSAFALAAGWLPPYRPNQVIDAFGVGPVLLFDTVRGGGGLDRGAGWLWRVAVPVAAAGTLALAAMVAAAIERARAERRDTDPALPFVLAIVAMYLVPFMVTDYFDRYLLFVLPFVIALWPLAVAEPQAARPAARAGALLLAGVAIVLSCVATRDYFSWNRARWSAIRAAEARGAVPDSLDGGFEYNGFHGFEAHRGGAPLPGKSWYWVRDDRFVVALTPVAGYQVVGRWPVKHLLPRTPPEVVLLERAP